MSNRTNGRTVEAFERAFAQYVGAEYGIACCNGTATLHTALIALGVKPGDRVAVPPLTMASTTLAVLHAGAVPVFRDVKRNTWTMELGPDPVSIPVSLYGMWSGCGGWLIDDAAQTLQQHKSGPGPAPAFTSYSFQASKILSTGEGGMLVTNDPELAAKARQFRDLGYPPDARANLKHPDAIRHVSIGWNYRLSDMQAAHLIRELEHADERLAARRYSAECYAQAIQGCDWITPQYVPDGWPHSWWTYAIALNQKGLWEPMAARIVGYGGERPYAAWRLTYQEPAFRHLAPDGTCPIAERLQPRLMQLQTNHDKAGAERAAEVLHSAIASF